MVRAVAPPATDFAAWMGVRFDLPADWAIVRHGLDPRQGQLTLADRRRQRIQLNWRTLDSEPDLQRMAEDYRARQREQDPECDVNLLRQVRHWRGTVRHADGGATLTRAMTYSDDHDRLIEVVAIEDERSRAAGWDVRDWLQSVSVDAAGEDATHWRAFGLDVHLPDDGPWRLRRARVLPMDVTLVFEKPEASRHRIPAVVRVRRQAMASDWLSDDLDAHLRQTVDGQALETTEPRITAHAAAAVVGLEAGPRVSRWAGRLRAIHAEAWHCEESDTVFSLVRLWPRRRDGAADDPNVRCCEGGRSR